MCSQHAGDVVLIAEAVALRRVDEALPASWSRAINPAACGLGIFHAMQQALGSRAELNPST